MFVFFKVWRTEALIASLAFHPFERVLLIAAYDEIVFWDGGRDDDGCGDTAEPFARIKTANEERVRYVKFDALGNKLITGIANMGPHPPPPVPPSLSTSSTTAVSNYSFDSRLRWERTSMRQPA